MRTITVVAPLILGLVASVAHAQKVERGMQVYADQKCSRCHSIDGKGNAKGSLDGVGSKLTGEEVRQWLTNPEEMTKKANAKRKPMMKSYPSLSQEDQDAIVAYMLSLKKK